MRHARSFAASLVIAVLLASAGCRDERGTDAAFEAVDVRPFDEQTLAPLVKRAAPAVVNIAVLQASPAEQNPLLRDPYFRRYFGIPDEAVAPVLAAGSGVIVDGKRGIVLTNNHVVEGARQIEVSLTDRRRFPAELVGTDPATDLAVLRIQGPELPQLPLGDSARLQVGDYVVAIGNPFQLGQTVTAGIVSALDRGIDPQGYESYIQTDAAINPGNSGGALVDSEGKLIGINVAIATAGGSATEGSGSIGVGFSIPSDIVERITDEIIENGEATHGLLGASVQPAAAVEDSDITGAYIAEVVDGGAAAGAGLEVGDVVTGFNGVPITDATDLTAQVRAAAAGSDAEVTYVRDGETRTVEVTLGTLEQ
jgi:S1-C subfamily serine protease